MHKNRDDLQKLLTSNASLLQDLLIQYRCMIFEMATVENQADECPSSFDLAKINQRVKYFIGAYTELKQSADQKIVALKDELTARQLSHSECVREVLVPRSNRLEEALKEIKSSLPPHEHRQLDAILDLLEKGKFSEVVAKVAELEKSRCEVVLRSFEHIQLLAFLVQETLSELEQMVPTNDGIAALEEQVNDIEAQAVTIKAHFKRQKDLVSEYERVLAVQEVVSILSASGSQAPAEPSRSARDAQSAAVASHAAYLSIWSSDRVLGRYGHSAEFKYDYQAPQYGVVDNSGL